MKKVALSVTLSGLMLTTSSALADSYGPGTVIIPMDTTYQDLGMLKAYGLVYELLRNDVPVQWAIRAGKNYGGSDFTTSATTYPSGPTVTNHDYRGGPWLIRAEDAAKALPIIETWKAANTTTVHVATQAFEADIARYLVVAPTISMLADGNQKIARKYMQAAGIPDSTLSTAWLDSSPDMLTPNEIAGPTTTNHSDGMLFDEDGTPVYCQLMSMHWDVADAQAQPEVVAEVRSFLEHPTHFFAECQAVNAFENDPTHGHFLTPNGFLIASKPSLVDLDHADYPFAQMDGPFGTVGGSEPAYALPGNDTYKDNDIVMIRGKGLPVGDGDVWMTGFLDGTCSIQCEGESNCEERCLETGKVSYLGGHEYGTKLPMSSNPTTQGTRLFLNSLFEAQCATEVGQPEIELVKSAPAATASSQITYVIDYQNWGPSPALNAVLRDTLPAGATFVSATDGGVHSNGEVTWDLGNLGNDEDGSVSVTVTLAAYGEYENQARLDYKVGLNSRSKESNVITTLYDGDADGDGVVDSLDNCPEDYNPLQNLNNDVDNCGYCGNTCTTPNGTPICLAGSCFIEACDTDYSDCDGVVATGCEFPNSAFEDDEANCGYCDQVCAPAHATGECQSGDCTLGACDSGRADCNGSLVDGCEYDESNFATDNNHCGNCFTQCGAGEFCDAGTCAPSPCPAGTANCGGAIDCETNILTSNGNCGGCNVACAPPHATGSCTAGVCNVGSCSAGYSDCNGLAGDGCEYLDANFQSDKNNCGGCGNACSAANGSAACDQGACVITQCNSGYSDCNGDTADGCEFAQAGFDSNLAHCGGCNNACAPAHATGQCTGGSCGIASCDSGYVDLDGDAQNGCELACSVTGEPETTCNGVDDDCDGEIDEDYAPYSCGQGACQAASTCSAGSEACTPASAGTEGPNGSPSCIDSTDNDCDGDADADDSDCDAPPSGGGGDSAGGAGNEAGAGNADGGAPDGSGGEPTDGGSTGGKGGSTSTGGSTGTASGAGGSASGSGGSAPGTSDGAGSSSNESGGCGCRVASTQRPWSGASALLLLAATVLRRRRTGRAA